MAIINITIPDTHSVSFYCSMFEHPILNNFNLLMDLINDSNNFDSAKKTYYILKRFILEYANSKEEANHYANNIWQDFIISQLISNKNELTLLFEKSLVDRSFSNYKEMLSEIEVICHLFFFDWDLFLSETGLDKNNLFSSPVFFAIPPLNNIDLAMKTKDPEIILSSINKKIYADGLNIFEYNHLFHYDQQSKNHLCVKTEQDFNLSQLIGYDEQKEALISNTTSFINDHTGENILLQGAFGTGKTTMILSLINAFKKTNLRMIELNSNMISVIPEIIPNISQSGYPFILFIDDLSFDENNNDFKSLNAIFNHYIKDQKNILIYATSDKRYLAKERLFERDNTKIDTTIDDVSVNNIFKQILFFNIPSQSEYLSIVSQLAEKESLNINKPQLENLAIQWELQHLNRSGLTAKKFIDSLICNPSSE